jgi:hypothetical protein
MAHELKMPWKKAVVAKFETVFRHWPGGTEKIHRQPFMVVDFLAEI